MRPPLTDEAIEANMQTYARQARWSTWSG